jgi:hypothetical protein
LASGASAAVLTYTYFLEKITAKNYEWSLFNWYTFRRLCGLIFPSCVQIYCIKMNPNIFKTRKNWLNIGCIKYPLCHSCSKRRGSQ